MHIDQGKFEQTIEPNAIPWRKEKQSFNLIQKKHTKSTIPDLFPVSRLISVPNSSRPACLQMVPASDIIKSGKQWLRIGNSSVHQTDNTANSSGGKTKYFGQFYASSSTRTHRSLGLVDSIGYGWAFCFQNAIIYEISSCPIIQEQPKASQNRTHVHLLCWKTTMLLELDRLYNKHNSPIIQTIWKREGEKR